MANHFFVDITTVDFIVCRIVRVSDPGHCIAVVVALSTIPVPAVTWQQFTNAQVMPGVVTTVIISRDCNYEYRSKRNIRFTIPCASV